MASSLRCKVTGCDLDDCGVCRRCGSTAKAQHRWVEAERLRPCFTRKVCERCDTDHESPDHDWETGTGAAGDIQMTCTRCGLKI